MSDESEELYSLLIPLSEDRLIVPRACVAEVVRFGKSDVAQGGEAWMVGSVNWNGRCSACGLVRGHDGQGDSVHQPGEPVSSCSIRRSPR